MKLPQGSFLELAFYFSELADRDALSRLVTTLADLGASFAGTGWVHQEPGIRDAPFGGVTDVPQEPVQIGDRDEFHRWLEDPDARLVQVAMNDASGLTRDSAELVTYIRVSDESARDDHHPLAIWTEGGVMCDPLFDEIDLITARREGHRVYRRFHALLERLRPSYAAITCEIPLKCPADLRADPNGSAFREFFVSVDYLDRDALAQVRALFSSAYIEDIGFGLYVSWTDPLKPENRAKPFDAEIGKAVAKIIAAAG